jgi:hypothetical protein
MGVISRAVDKLPSWVQVILAVFGVIVGLYEIGHYGFWHFLLRLIFSPTL